MERLFKFMCRFIHLLSNAKQIRIFLKYVLQTLRESLFIDMFLHNLLLLGLTGPLTESSVWKLFLDIRLTQVTFVYLTYTIFKHFERHWITFG